MKTITEDDLLQLKLAVLDTIGQTIFDRLEYYAADLAHLRKLQPDDPDTINELRATIYQRKESIAMWPIYEEYLQKKQEYEQSRKYNS